MTDLAEDVLSRMPTGAATRRLGVHPDTLKAWLKAGKIEAERTASGRMLWNVARYLRRQQAKVA